MEINVYNNRKLVDIWLTRAERDDERLRENIKPLYQDYAKRHYTVAVFLSGEQNLAEETGALLCYNRNRLAELEVQREREREPVMEGQGPFGMTMRM